MEQITKYSIIRKKIGGTIMPLIMTIFMLPDSSFANSGSERHSSVGASVASVGSSLQNVFIKNAKTQLRKAKRAQKKQTSLFGRQTRGEMNDRRYSTSNSYDTAAPSSTPTPSASPTPTPIPTPSSTSTKSVVFGGNCPNGGRFYFAGQATVDLTTGAVQYRGTTTFNNCGNGGLYGIVGTTASTLPSQGGFSMDTAGAFSATTQVCSSAYTNAAYDLSFDGTKNTRLVSGQVNVYCGTTLIESCIFPADTQVNSSLSNYCTQVTMPQ